MQGDSLAAHRLSPMDTQTWQDLAFDQLLQATDRTFTLVGHWGLRTLTSAAASEQVQPALEFFMRESKILQEITRELEGIQIVQQSLLAQFDPTDHVNQLAETMYCQFMREHAKQYFLPQQFMSVAEKWHLMAQFLLGNPIMLGKVYRAGYQLGNRCQLHREAITCNKCQTHQEKINCAAVGCNKHLQGQISGLIPAGIMCGILAMPLRKYFADAYRNSNNAAILQNRLVDIASLMQISQRLYNLILSNKALAKHPAAAYLVKFMNNMQKPHMQRLRTVLKRKTFTRKSKWRFWRGRVLQANLLLQDCKDSFLDLLRAIALLDASVSMVRFMQETTQEGCVWCRPVFVNQYIQCDIRNGWLPLAAELRVTNDITLGGLFPRAMVLSGPNGTGKSTILKTISFIVMLAQSWGYCPASSCVLTRFNIVRSHKNPHEDLSRGKSTFMAQQARAAELLRLNKQDVPQLLLLDEPFNGTLERQGADRARDLIWNLVQHPQAIVCAATHFYQPTLLSQKAPGFIANYQMELVRENNHFKRTFRLLPGCATWWFQAEQYHLQKEFIEQLGEEHVVQDTNIASQDINLVKLPICK